MRTFIISNATLFALNHLYQAQTGRQVMPAKAKDHWNSYVELDEEVVGVLKAVLGLPPTADLTNSQADEAVACMVEMIRGGGSARKH